MKKLLSTVCVVICLFIGLSTTSKAATNRGWIYSHGHWSFYSNSGSLYKGWLKSGSTWYFLDKTGAMKTGWVSINGKWYYFDNSGVMKTGWLHQGSVSYYLKSDGSMATSTIINGNAFGKNGAWLPDGFDMADILQPYFSGFDISSNKEMHLGGKTYTKGYQFVTNADKTKFDFNLEGKYTTIKGIIGLEDEAIYNGTMDIYGDDQLLSSNTFNLGDLPKTLNLNVKGVKKLEFVMHSGGYYIADAAFIDFVNVKIK